MSNTYTPNVKLAQPAIGDTGWAVPVNGNVAILDAMSPLGALCVTAAEVPSASLNVAVSAGNMINASGVLVAYAGTASRAMAPSTTTYVWLSDAGVLSTGASFPTAGTQFVPLARVVAGSSTITGITDLRAAFRSVSQ